MRSLRGYAAVIQHQYLVGREDRAYALGHDESGGAFHEIGQGILDPGFRLHVDRTGAVVQYKHGGASQYGACYGDTLFLASG